MIINKIDNYYIVKLIGKQIDIYNKNELEELTKKIITKILKDNKIQNYIHLEIYPNKHYGTIIKVSHYNSPFISKKEKTVKLTINTENTFLYKTDYFNIINKLPQNKIYYYKNNFYLELNNKISTKDYLNILETSEVIYENTNHILDKAIKI